MPHHHRKAFAGEVERDLVHLLVLRDGRVLVLQDRVVQGALDARFKVTVQVDEPQDVVVVLALDVHMPVQHDLAFGQCAGLVAAEDLHAAEVLNGRKLLDQDFLLSHPPGALGQRDGDDHRHHLRCHPYGQRDGEEERLQQRTVKQDVHQQDEQHEPHDHPCDHQPEVADATAELGLRRPHGQPLGNRAEGGVSACADDDRGANPCLNSSPQENAVAGVGNSVFPLWKIIRRLLDGQRLSRERGLAHVQILDVQQAGVRRHQVPSIEPDDVPWDQFRNRELLFLAIPENRGGCRHLLPDLLHRMSRLELHDRSSAVRSAGPSR